MASKFYRDNGFQGVQSGSGRTLRPRAKLVKFDPYARNSRKMASKELCSNWSFFETTDCYLIDEDVSGRVAHNPQHGVQFFYLGRNTNLGKPTVVKFSMYQGAKIASFLGMLLDQYAAMEAKRVEEELDEGPLIPFLRGKEDRTYSSKDENRLLFWSDPDLELGTVRVKVLVNKIIGQPEVIINCPVPSKISEGLKGWPGPCLHFTMASVSNLEAFILEHRRECMDAHVAVRPKVNPVGAEGHAEPKE